MRRVLGVTVVAVLLLAGCGSSSSGSDPVTTELSYFPSNAPFVLSVATDPNSNAVHQAQGLANRFPIASFGESALKVRLQQLGINYQNDIRPLFGNPIMVGASGPSLSGAGNNYLFVWVAKDAGKLTALVKKLSGVRQVGSHDGATLYDAGASTTLAVAGATAVLGPSQSSVNTALDRHAHDAGIRSADYSRALAGLPKNSLIEAYGNIAGVLSGSARNVPWVAALRGYGATVNASSSGLTVQYHLDTTGGTLTASQLPFAEGSAAPSFAGTMPITVGVHNPSQIFAFAEAAEQASNPAAYSRFQKRQAAVRAKTGADLNSLASLLTGDLIIASNTHTTMGRAAVSNATSARQTLAKLMTDPKSVFSSATTVTKLPGGFYAVREKGRTIFAGVVGASLVAGNARPAALSAFANAPTTPAPGAQGAVAFRVGLGELLHLALKQAPPKVVQSILSSLGDINGWSAASTSGVTGSAVLGLH